MYSVYIYIYINICTVSTQDCNRAWRHLVIKLIYQCELENVIIVISWLNSFNSSTRLFVEPTVQCSLCHWLP